MMGLDFFNSDAQTPPSPFCRPRFAGCKATAPTASGTTSKTDAVSMIPDVKALAERAGGYDKLKELVDALAE